MDIEAIKDLRNKLPDNWKWHKCYELPYVNSRTGREFNLKHWALTAPDVKGVVCSIGLISHDHHTETHKKFLENDVPVEWVEKSLLIVDSLLRELEVLRRWKAEAIEVMPDMQAIGKALGLRIGESIHDKILPGIEKLKQKAATPTIGARWVSGTPKLTAPCVFVSKTSSKTGYDYAVWEAMYIDNGDGSYLALCDGDGEEWGDINDFRCDEHYIVSNESPCTCASLPTRNEAESFAEGIEDGHCRMAAMLMYDWIAEKIKTGQ